MSVSIADSPTKRAIVSATTKTNPATKANNPKTNPKTVQNPITQPNKTQWSNSS